MLHNLNEIGESNQGAELISRKNNNKGASELRSQAKHKPSTGKRRTSNQNITYREFNTQFSLRDQVRQKRPSHNPTKIEMFTKLCNSSRRCANGKNMPVISIERATATEPVLIMLLFPAQHRHTMARKLARCDDPITGLVNNRIERSIITSLKAGKIKRGLEV